MIQENGCRRLINSFVDHAPRDEDTLLIFHAGALYCPGDDQLCFPRIEELSAPRDALRFLFELGGVRYFRANREDILEELPPGRWLGAQQLRYLSPKYLAFTGVLGLQLDQWYRTRAFCGQCGEKQQHDKVERAMVCPSCGHRDYPNLSPAVIVGVIHEDSLLLTKYAGRVRPHWALVAGYAEIGETFEECVAREVMEETGLKVKQISYYKSQPWPFSSSLLVGYYALVDGEPHVRVDGRELGEAVFFKRQDIDVAFEDSAMTNEMICAFKKYGPGPLIYRDPLRQDRFEP